MKGIPVIAKYLKLKKIVSLRVYYLEKMFCVKPYCFYIESGKWQISDGTEKETEAQVK